MKHFIKYLVCFVFMTIFIGNVDAAGNTISLKLSCPNEVNPKTTFNCDLYANITGNNIEELKNIDVSFEDSITKIVSSNINEGISKTGKDIKIGEISAKTGSSGIGRVIVSFDAKFEDGEPLWRYNISTAKSIKVVSSNNNLTSLKVDGVTVNGFSKDKKNYYTETANEKVTISAIKQSSSATVAGTGEKQLKCGNNTYYVSVKAENGNVKKYGITVKRKCSNNAYLKGITISSGVLSPEFKEDVYEYKVKLEKDVEVISVTGVKDDATQKITGEVTNKKIDFGITKISLVVTSQTGEKKTYNITFEKEDNRDDNSLLSSLSLSSGNIMFDPNTFEYETKVLYTVETIKVLAVPEKESTKVTVEGADKLKVGENTITITAKSEKGTTGKYVIKVTRLNEGETLGDNPNIKELSVEGYDLPFDYERDNYKLVIDDEDWLNITVIMDDESATYEIKGNEDLKDGSIIEIITKSLDGSTRTYTIEITKPDSTIYYIIAGIVLALVIAIPIFVYFKSVKKKKELLDVNGYKIGKEYEEKDYSRKIIGNNSNKQENKQPEIPKIIKQNDNNVIEPSKPKKEEYIEDLDADLLDYVPNESINKCPGCGRELLGTPTECPYCKVRLK